MMTRCLDVEVLSSAIETCNFYVRIQLIIIINNNQEEKEEDLQLVPHTGSRDTVLTSVSFTPSS